MRDYVSIGCTPAAEDCVQVSKSGAYMTEMRAECQRFRDLLQRAYPACAFRIKSNPHDFGSYLDVEAVFDDQNEAAMDAAFAAESCPETWEALEAMASRVDAEQLEEARQDSVGQLKTFAGVD